MVRSRRSISKEDASSVLADSGISLSSPPGAAPLDEDEETAIIELLTGSSAQVAPHILRLLRPKHVVPDPDEDDNDDDDEYEEEDPSAEEPAVGSKKADDTTLAAKTEPPTQAEAQPEPPPTEEKERKASLRLKPGRTTLRLKSQAGEPKCKLEPSAQPPAPPSAGLAKRASRSASSFTLSSSSSLSSLSASASASASASLESSEDSSEGSPAPPPPKARSAAKRPRKTHICAVCDKEFGGNTDLKRHMLIHSDERPYECGQCGKRYRQAVNLKNHVTSTHESQRRFACTQCPKTFALKERLRLHMRLHSGEKPYACEHCEKRFARGGQLQQHIVSHHKSTTKQYKCEKCSATFSTTANLRVHTARHDEGPDHYCEICNELFANDVVLRAHVNKMHFKLKQFDCDICKKTIDDDDLATHMRTHTHVKMHICEVCNSYFTQKSQYNVHMRMHTGERPYQCRICWQTFAHSSVLKLHIRKHTGEKPFNCLLCKDEVAFSQLAHLKTHMKKIHKQDNPYMCEGCQQFFKIKIDLQAHTPHCSKAVESDSAGVGEQQSNTSKASDMQTLSHLRFLVAVLLKKISSEQKLKQLGYEKRLIDNVVIASLKLANRKSHDDHSLSAIDRMRLNVEEFLNWIVPDKVMQTFRAEQLSVECILDKIVTMYLKQK